MATGEIGNMEVWQCAVCDLIYDEVNGSPKKQVAAGTTWEEIGESWKCPDCGAGKASFRKVPLDIFLDRIFSYE